VSNESYKIAIITGGSRGLGRNTAIHLACTFSSRTTRILLKPRASSAR